MKETWKRLTVEVHNKLALIFQKKILVGVDLDFVGGGGGDISVPFPPSA